MIVNPVFAHQNIAPIFFFMQLDQYMELTLSNSFLPSEKAEHSLLVNNCENDHKNKSVRALPNNPFGFSVSDKTPCTSRQQNTLWKKLNFPHTLAKIP